MPLADIKSLSYHYPDGTVALRGVSFRITDGETVGLVGPNGAGKSTLLWHLNGLLPSRGGDHYHDHGAGQGGWHRHVDPPAVWIDGLTAEPANLPRIRATVGLVFQDPDDQLFCPTVHEDVAFGPTNQGLPTAEVERRVAESLAAVDLAGLDNRLPHRLSFGERKRVCLAGVLACNPRLLVMDEPTANLDPRARRHFMQLVRRLGCAKLIASLDLEMILELCDRVILLDRGKIYADGPAAAVLANEPMLLEHGLELPLSLKLGAAPAVRQADQNGAGQGGRP
jgi:energy-coupling factor transporter ATP-binding protein EcfA2